MKKRLFVTMFAAMAFAGMSYVSAIADGKKACDKKGDSCCELSASLKLSKEQKAKAEEFQTECKKAKIQATADIKTARIDLSTLLKKDTIDKAAVDAKVNEIGDFIKKALKEKYECKVKILSILDAEQKKAFLEHDCCDGEHGDHDCGGKRGGCEKREKKMKGSSEKM